jgi:hypothetical protein
MAIWLGGFQRAVDPRRGVVSACTFRWTREQLQPFFHPLSDLFKTPLIHAIFLDTPRWRLVALCDEHLNPTPWGAEADLRLAPIICSKL